MTAVVAEPGMPSVSIGTIALAAELYTPGIGIGAFIAMLCFALFFGGQYAASLAGWEELVVFMVGVVFLAVEILVLPGFGVAGIISPLVGWIAVGAGITATTMASVMVGCAVIGVIALWLVVRPRTVERLAP